MDNINHLNTVDEEIALTETDQNKKVRTAGIDGILNMVGGSTGRYQILLLITMIMCKLFPGIITMSPVFTAALVNYTCSQDWINQTFSSDCLIKQSDDACQLTVNCTGQLSQTQDCTAWDFDTSLFTSTTVTEYSLVCSRASFRYFASMSFFLGFTIGCIVYGNLSDKFGRRKTILVTIVHLSIILFLTAIIKSLWGFIVLQGIAGIGNGGLHTILFTYALEAPTTEWRSFWGFTVHNGWTAGILLLTLLAYFERRYQFLILYCAVAVLIVLFPLCFFLSESPRWLLSQSNFAEADKVFIRIARINKVMLPKNFSSENMLTQKNKENKKMIKKEKENVKKTGEIYYNLFHLFKTPGLRKLTFITVTLFFIVSMTYYGISLSVGDLGGSIFVNQLYSAIVEPIGRGTGILLSKRIGRRALLSLSFLLTGVSLAVSVTMVLIGNPALSMVRTIFAMIAKLWITLAFDVVWVYTGEVFPTVVRTLGSGVASSMARIGAMVSQALQTLEIVWKPLPFILFAVAPFIIPLVAYFAPETRGKKLPQSLEDGEKFAMTKKNTMVKNKT